MTEPRGVLPPERRRTERRQMARVADLTLPEFRRILITSAVFVLALALFLWMVRTVVIAGILAVILAAYARPLCVRLSAAARSRSVGALLTMSVIVLPLLAVVTYSTAELQGTARYVSTHQDEIVGRIDASMRRLPVSVGPNVSDQIRTALVAAGSSGTRLVASLRAALAELAVSATVFLVTTFYALTHAEGIARYVGTKVPPRYGELAAALEHNVRGVIHGTMYATLVTQAAKSLIILLMNLAFHVPLAMVLAVVSFVIGLFPVLGSWTVYVPVALWLFMFRGAWLSALLMLTLGFVGNTLFISMYIRPKLAAEKSRVLDFYWMFIGLVTGVYTFGLVGIVLGPLLIGILKATLDTITTRESWRLLDASDGEAGQIV